MKVFTPICYLKQDSTL